MKRTTQNTIDEITQLEIQLSQMTVAGAAPNKTLCVLRKIQKLRAKL